MTDDAQFLGPDKMVDFDHQPAYVSGLNLTRQALSARLKVTRMSTSRSGVLGLLLLAGLGLVLVVGGFFVYGSRYLRQVAKAEQYLATELVPVMPEALIASSTESAVISSDALEATSTTPPTAPLLN